DEACAREWRGRRPEPARRQQPDVGAYCQPAKHMRHLERPHDTEMENVRWREPDQAASLEPYVAAPWQNGARAPVEHRRLTRAVRPEDRPNLSGLDRQADAIDGREPAKPPGQIARLEHPLRLADEGFASGFAAPHHQRIGIVDFGDVRSVILVGVVEPGF